MIEKKSKLFKVGKVRINKTLKDIYNNKITTAINKDK